MQKGLYRQCYIYLPRRIETEQFLFAVIVLLQLPREFKLTLFKEVHGKAIGSRQNIISQDNNVGQIAKERDF